MPELPEVEATAAYLREKLAGRTIGTVEVGWRRTISTHEIAEFQSRLAGAEFRSVGRRGKFVSFTLETAAGAAFLLGHMRMSGSFDVLPAGMGRDVHDRVIMGLDDGRELRFNDPRKFGRLYLVADPDEIVGKLGPEPLGDELSVEDFSSRIGGSRGRVKSVLLDQRKVAGLGNIYVDEALWRARIHPMRQAHTLSARQLSELFVAVREVLSEAIEFLGTDFGDGVVEGGMYRPRVYGRTEEPCHRCGAPIRRLVVGQRGTHVCAKCQPAPRKLRAR